MIFPHKEIMEHLFNVCGDSNRFTSEPHQNSQKTIVQVWSGQQHIAKGHSGMFGTGVKHNADLTWLPREIHFEGWEVPAFFSF